MCYVTKYETRTTNFFTMLILLMLAISPTKSSAGSGDAAICVRFIDSKSIRGVQMMSKKAITIQPFCAGKAINLWWCSHDPKSDNYCRSGTGMVAQIDDRHYEPAFIGNDSIPEFTACFQPRYPSRDGCK